MTISRASLAAAAIASATLMAACSSSRFCPEPAPVGPFGAPADAKAPAPKAEPRRVVRAKEQPVPLNPCGVVCQTECKPDNPARPKWCALHENPR